MALNLSTLTNPATSGDVLAEALTTADFLEPVPVLRNLARGSQKGGDAKQSVSLNQPKALPLIDGDGYLYLSGVSFNFAQTPDDSSLDITGDLVIDVDVTMKSWTPTSNSAFCGKYLSSGDQRSFRFLLRTDKRLQFYFSDTGTASSLSGLTSTVAVPFSDNQRGQVRVAFNSSNGIIQFFTSTDKGQNWTQLGGDRTQSRTSIFNSTADVYIGSYFSNSELVEDAAIHSVKFYDSVTPSASSLRFNCDFTATNVRHGDTKIKCGSGQVVTINQSGNDPATIIKKPVLRFDGTNDGLRGLFNQTITDGYMFAAFSVLGDGGEFSGRVFSINSTGQLDSDASGSGAILSIQQGTDTNLRTYVSGGYRTNHPALFDDANGDILHESLIKDGTQLSRVNNADQSTTSVATSISAEEFSVASRSNLDYNTAIDLEYLALFPATITDAQADDVRNYINNRNNVFSLVDGFAYYFYDAQSAPVGAISSGSSSWNGRIVGSDNGDTDRYLTQGTSNDAPVGSGYTVTFADNSDHLDIPSTTQAGWQVVGTSLGTFAYRVNANAVTELNLLGNLGSTSFRKAGDLYGVILLPESATGADIEAARKLLIDRGAADGTTTNNLYTAWYQRDDIVEFKHTDTSGVTSANDAWGLSDNLAIFPPLDLSSCASFQRTWQSCSALTSFPAGAKLGTSSSNVNFTSAWQSSGLQSFPADIDLSGGTVFTHAWRQTSLTSFPANQSMRNSNSFYGAWRLCTSMTSFAEGVFDSWNPSSISSGVFDFAFDGCSAMTALSVQNILTSIDTSGQFATTNGASGGTALGNSEIEIDYNTATGSLSAATNAAIESLSGKGWQVIVNNVNLSLNNTYSVAFDGTDDYMSMTLPVLGNTHTLSAWFKTTTSYGGAGSEGTLISYISSGGGNDDSVLSVTTNKVGWSDFTDDNQFGTSTVNDGNWHHAVAVVTATTQKIYVDGSLETTTSNAYSAGTSFSSATIGRRANAAQRYFGGNIDEVAIWNSELSATDVTAIYNGGRPLNLNVNTNGYDNSSTLVAWWRMGDNDSGTGSTVTDNSANSYNGTLINGPTFQTNTP